jgi:hypothetical protein
MVLVRIIPYSTLICNIYIQRLSQAEKLNLERHLWKHLDENSRFISITFTRILALTADQEEAGIRAPLEHAGSLLFISEGAEWAFQIEIYRANSYEGTVTE